MTTKDTKTLASHTPGPWRVSATGKGVQALFRHDSAGGEVEFWTDVAQTPSQGAVKAYRQANARLIAAAPDMLAALQAVNQWFDAEEFVPSVNGQRSGYTIELGPKITAVRNAVSAAIAKATGD